MVQALAAHGVVRKFPKNAVIITEGDPSDSLYVILSGRVKVYLSDAEGREVVLNEHGPGSYVGEMAFDDMPRSASVMTLEPCTFSVISGKEFRSFVVSNPDATMHLIRNLIRRALGHDAPAALPALGSEIDNPVGVRPDVEIVLDHHHRIAGVHQSVQHPQQLFHVRHVQADRGLIEHVQGVPGGRRKA